jgi:hypothetical protein
MRAIFISYRRDDTEGYAGRLFRDLRERFGKDAVFMDVAGIDPGRDFRRVIEEQVASCGVLLALIGKAWLTVADDAGKRRLDDPNDFVRLETTSALKRDIPVIPVLVQQAEMPRAEKLPDGLKDLAFRNSVELTHARWESDVELLIAALSRYVDPSKPIATVSAPAVTSAAPVNRHPAWVIVPLATVALGGIGYIAWDRFGPGDAETKGVSTAAAPLVAASAPAQTVVQSPASATAPISAPLHEAAPALQQASAPAPPSLEASTPKRSATTPVAPQPASARHVDRPVVAKAVAPPPPYYSPSPSPSPAPPPETTATRSAPAATVAAAAAPPAAPVESPVPEATPGRHDRSLELLGGAGSPSMVTRTIVIKPGTNYVNVTSGEVIRFEVGDHSFIWNFNGTRTSFDLAQVAPPSLLDRKVTAYVAPNPSLRRR